MLTWIRILLGTLRSACRSRGELALGNLALRQQLALFKHRYPRSRLQKFDRLFWMVVSRIWSKWRSALHVVQSATVVRWHRQGFRYYWSWRSRRRGRPKLDPEIRQLIRRMCLANPLWGAPRIHGELMKLGIDVSEATVSKYVILRRGPPSQSWRTFLSNHAKDTLSLDFFTATFRILFVLIILSDDRRRIVHFNVTAHPSAAWTAQQLLETCSFDEKPEYLIRDRDKTYGGEFRRQAKVLGIEEVITVYRSPWHNPYAERVIGSIRRDCLEHVIVLGERHLKRILSEYVNYYNNTRTHLSLDKDTPAGRPVQHPEQGRVVALRRVGGLHHEYMRAAA